MLFEIENKINKLFNNIDEYQSGSVWRWNAAEQWCFTAEADVAKQGNGAS